MYDRAVYLNPLVFELCESLSEKSERFFLYYSRPFDNHLSIKLITRVTLSLKHSLDPNNQRHAKRANSISFKHSKTESK